MVGTGLVGVAMEELDGPALHGALPAARLMFG
jgi:hypothetical protein